MVPCGGAEALARCYGARPTATAIATAIATLPSPLCGGDSEARGVTSAVSHSGDSEERRKCGQDAVRGGVRTTSAHADKGAEGSGEAAASPSRLVPARLTAPLAYALDASFCVP